MNNNRQFVENMSQLINHTNRTKFSMSGADSGMVLTTINKGKLYPVYTMEILPGDTVRLDINALIRATTLIKPIFNNMWAQIQCFFVPNRLTYKHWEEVMGENKQGPFTSSKTEYEVPSVTAPSEGWNSKTLADYLGIPTKVGNIKVNSLYGKGYCQIWNDWYRDENRQNFTHITTDETELTGVNTSNYVTDAEKLGAILPVDKAHDMFTSSMIEPQKGPNVLLPLGTTAPVSVYGNGEQGIELMQKNATGIPTKNMYYTLGINGGTTGTDRGKALIFNGTNDGPLNNENTNILVKTSITAGQGAATGYVGLTNRPERSGIIGTADLSTAEAASVNDLRLAIALQQMYELDALAGTRYTEIIFSHFGVRSSDARLQRAEYLGGKKVPINITQVIQNSETAETPQGNLTAFSQTWDGDHYFTKSFEEHGILYVLVCIKGENLYQQGLPAKFSKFKRTDYHDPLFDGIGMQPIYNKEIYAQGTAQDDEAFGYKPAWEEYRTMEKIVTGEFRSNYSTSLDYWHIARDFSELPTNGEAFIEEGDKNLNRALTVGSDVADQFQCAFAINAEITRVMTPYGIPGLKRF